MTTDTISLTELAALSIEHRFGRIATALERLADAAERVAEIAERTAPAIERLATAAENGAATLSCLTEEVEGEDGETRCSLRAHNASTIALSRRGDS